MEIPDELEAALVADPIARDAFEQLPYAHRKEFVLWVTSAKRAETRERRLEQAVSMLRAGRRAP